MSSQLCVSLLLLLLVGKCITSVETPAQVTASDWDCPLTNTRQEYPGNTGQIQQQVLANKVSATTEATTEGRKESWGEETAARKAFTMAKRSLDNLQTLQDLDDEIREKLWDGERSYNGKIDDVKFCMERIVQLPTHQNPISQEETELLNSIGLQIQNPIFSMITLGLLPKSYAGQLLVEKLSRGGAQLFKVAPRHFDDFLGYPIYSSDGFSLASNFISLNSVGYLVFPPNVNPLRPLPFADYPLTKWQCIDMFFYELVTLSQTTAAAPLVRSVSLQWTSTTHKANLKHNCARWDNVEKRWDSTNCIVLKSTEFSQVVSCYCAFEFRYIALLEKFILYEYEEDIASTIHVDPSPASNSSSVASISSLKNYNLTSFSGFISQLSLVMRSDNLVLVNTSEDKVLEDIGQVLDKARPDPGYSTMGIRNNDLASFIIDLKSYRADPPIGFGVYTNHTSGIELFRLKEDINFRELLSPTMSFAFLFSPSVASQNSRFAFLLYPPGKFFKPTAFIDGHHVLSVRVLDVVLTLSNPYDQQQIVHMISPKFVEPKVSFGCAFWNASLSNWTSDNCHPNPDIYKGVCTCNMSAIFSESPWRGQFIGYTFPSLIFTPKSPEVSHTDWETKIEARSEIAILKIHVVCIGTGDNDPNILDLMEPLSIATKSKGLRQSTIRQVTGDLREYMFLGSRDISELTFASGFLIQGRFFLSNQQITFFCELNTNDCTTVRKEEQFLERKLFNTNVAYSFFLIPNILSSNVFGQAFILYPPRVSFHLVPRIKGHKVDNFRVIDVSLPNSPLDQFIQFYIDHPRGFAIGCAFWSDDLVKWTDTNCSVVIINSVEVCNCKFEYVSTARNRTTGGQYIVYTYSTVVFDENVYEKFGAELFTEANDILAQGAELISNASLSLFGVDADLATKAMRVYHKILTNTEEVPQRQETLNRILDNLDTVFDRFYVDPPVAVSFVFDIPTAWSIKNAELASDLYSNTVLSSGAVGGESTKLSDFAMAVIGHLQLDADTNLHGIRFARDENNTGGEYFEANGTANLVEDNPQLACFVTNSILLNDGRFIFAVYPLNLSPYPYTMTEHPMFNSRQIDVYAVSNGASTSDFRAMVQVYFQPTDFPKNYVKIACAVWSKATLNWTADVCTADVITLNRIVSCSCNLTVKRSLTRIMAYEYTELVNFSLMELFDGPSVVFIVSASFSFAGFAMIAITAVLFPTWRDELGNKVLMHLMISSFLYLCVTIFRETHIIFSDMKRLDLSLVVFTVCVHYTRLVHHCWGLVMSVLQYRKFSTIAGASATTHLLLKVAVFAWGAPLAPLVALLSWNLRGHFCTPDKLTHYMLYLVPVVIITLLNVGLLVAIVRNITNGCGLWDDEELKKHGGSGKDVYMRQLKQTVMMFFLFGIPTVFEMFNDIGSHNVALQYVDNILNPIQGFVMFLFFVVMNDKTRGLWIGNFFGDNKAVAATKPAPAKKVVFKVKAPRKTVNRPKKDKQTESMGQCAVGDEEIQIVASDAFKLVMHRGDVTDGNTTLSSGLEDANPGFGEVNARFGDDNTERSKNSETCSEFSRVGIETFEADSISRNMDGKTGTIDIATECCSSFKSVQSQKLLAWYPEDLQVIAQKRFSDVMSAIGKDLADKGFSIEGFSSQKLAESFVRDLHEFVAGRLANEKKSDSLSPPISEVVEGKESPGTGRPE